MFFLAAVSFVCVAIALGVESLYATTMFTLLFWIQCFAAGKMVSEYKRIKNVYNTT
jgi:hypothetical protein